MLTPLTARTNPEYVRPRNLTALEAAEWHGRAAKVAIARGDASAAWGQARMAAHFAALLLHRAGLTREELPSSALEASSELLTEALLRTLMQEARRPSRLDLFEVPVTVYGRTSTVRLVARELARRNGSPFHE